MFELFLVDVDWYIFAYEMFESSCMIEVEVANDNSFDVFDIVAGGLDGIWECVIVGVFDSGEDICQRSTPFLQIC